MINRYDIERTHQALAWWAAIPRHRLLPLPVAMRRVPVGALCRPERERCCSFELATRSHLAKGASGNTRAAAAARTRAGSVVARSQTLRTADLTIVLSARRAALNAEANARAMLRSQRRAIAPPSRTTVAGDTGRVLPPAALVLTRCGRSSITSVR